MTSRSPQRAEEMRQASPALRMCTAVLAFAPFFMTHALASTAQDPSHVAQIQAVLDLPDREGALEQLQRMGPGAASSVWILLSGQNGLDESYDLLPHQRELLLMAIESWPKGQVVKALMESLEAGAAINDRLTMIELVARTRSGNAIPAIIRILDGVDPILLRSTVVTNSLQRSLVGLFAEGKAEFRILRRTLPSAPSELLPILIEVVSQVRSPESMQMLADIVRREPRLGQAALQHIAGFGDTLLPPSADAIVEMARTQLRADSLIQRRVALDALGSLQDSASFVDIVDCLDADDPVLRRLAQVALEKITGLRKRWGADQWLAWHDAEQRWLGSTDKLARDLAGQDLYRAAKAVRELSEHTLSPRSINDLLAEGLDHDHARIRTMACEGLGDSGHVSAVGYLIEALLDDDQGVRSAARTALIKLAGEDLGDDGQAWRAWWKTLW